MSGERNKRGEIGDGRDAGGRFVPGCPPGPGRPRRAVEREYLAALSEACPPETWREICQRAVEDAKAGDATARAWLAKYLIGQEPPKLLDLAADEAGGHDADAEIAAAAERRTTDRKCLMLAVALRAGAEQRRAEPETAGRGVVWGRPRRVT